MEGIKKFDWQMVRDVVDNFWGEEFLGRRAREYIEKNFQVLGDEEKETLLIFAEEYLFIKRVVAKKHFDIWLLREDNLAIINYYSKILPVSTNQEGIIRDILKSYFVSEIIENELQKIILPYITEADIQNYYSAPSKQEKTEALFQTAKRICNQNKLGRISRPAFKEIMRFVFKQIHIENRAKEIRENQPQKTKNFLTRIWGILKK